MRACIDQYGALVWSLARRFLRSGADAEDAVQEIFIDLWRSAGRFDPAVSSEVTFVAMIARRRLIDRVRAGANRAGDLDPSVLESNTPAAPTADRLDLGDEASVAAAALERLDPQQQRTMRLAIVHGLSHEQVAKVTGLPLGTVKTNIRRGLIRIREMLSARTQAGVSP